MDEKQIREIADRFLRALSDLWNATDWGETQDISIYSEQELKQILGEWEQVRKVCDSIFREIRETHPELPAWSPIVGERPAGQLD